MKSIILFLAVILTTVCSISAQNPDLLKWANKVEGSNIQNAKKAGTKNAKYKIALKDGIYQYKGEASYPNLSNQEIFYNALLFLANWDEGDERYIITEFGKELKKVDIPTARLIKVSPEESMANFETGVNFRPAGYIANYYNIFNITLSVHEKKISFVIHKIRRTSHRFGGKSYTTNFEDRYKKIDNLSSDSETELSSFNVALTEFIDKFKGFIAKNTNEYPIIHWDNIRKHTICEGMSTTECILSWGLPREKNSSWAGDVSIVQYVYSGTYVHFTNGKISSIINL